MDLAREKIRLETAAAPTTYLLTIKRLIKRNHLRCNNFKHFSSFRYSSTALSHVLHIGYVSLIVRMKLLSAKQYSTPTRKKLIVGLLVGSCLLAISHLPQPVRSQVSVASVVSVLHLTKEVVSSVIETWDLVEEVGDIHLPFKRNKDEKILKRMFELSLQIERSERNVSGSRKAPSSTAKIWNVCRSYPPWSSRSAV